MKAFQITAKTVLDELLLSELPEPVAGPGEVLIRLQAAALNHRDLAMFDWEPDRTFILGADGAGVVEAVGPGVTTPAVGTPVLINPALNWGDRQDAFSPGFSILGWPRDGTFAEAVVVPAENAHPKPEHLSFHEAAALPLAGLTAFRAVVVRAAVRPGERVLVHGIGGGVALFALQFARAAGAVVIVTSTVDEKLKRARALGADAGVNARTANWPAAVREWSGGNGVDVVIDSIGGELYASSLPLLRPGGRLVSYGTTVSEQANIDLSTLFWHQLNLLGSTMGSPQDFRAMLAFVETAKLKPIIDSVWPLAQGSAALQRLAQGRQFGKIVLQIK